MIYWNLNSLEACAEVDNIVLSTDSDQIAEIATGFGFAKLELHHRSAASASDTASTESAMLEYLEEADLGGNDIFVLVQATSPFTTATHFSEALRQYSSSELDSLLSVCRTKRFFWNKDGTPLNYDFTRRPRRQDFEGLLMENGAFYISRVEAILASKNRLSGTIGLYEMPMHTALELDEPEDWIVGEELMKGMDE